MNHPVPVVLPMKLMYIISCLMLILSQHEIILMLVCKKMYLYKIGMKNDICQAKQKV